MCTQPVILDSTLHSPEAVQFEEALRAKIVRQEEAVQAIVVKHRVAPDRERSSTLSPGLNSPIRRRAGIRFTWTKPWAKADHARYAQKAAHPKLAKS